MFRLSAIAAVFLTLNAAPLAAHEFWLMPRDFTPDAGANLEIDIKVGQDFKGNTYGFSPQQFNSFQIFNGADAVDVTGRAGDYPAVNQLPAGAGLNVVTHFSTASRLVWDEREKFDSFITAHGMDWVTAAHAARGLPELGFAEAYTRFAKTLVATGNGAGEDFRTGLFFELVAGANPYTDDLSAGLPVQLFYLDAPAAGAQIDIFVVPPGGELTRSHVVTDAEGRAIIPPTGAGAIMLNAVIMIEPFAEDAESVDYVWHSLWASLTYEAQ